MAQLIFGKNQQIEFASNQEFFEALGFLSKNDGTTSIHWEHNENQGAWGSEGRIHCYRNIERFPRAFRAAFTAGVGKIIHRVNCNEYIRYIVVHYGFQIGTEQDVAEIRQAISNVDITHFDRGLQL
ncbi:MAG: hypothetical protein N4A35_16895 [Flavobacteriales bacterium]|jgi:hypothetical protein|nr:hypothetical protein [Flavobacteriales bacterium]